MGQVSSQLPAFPLRRPPFGYRLYRFLSAGVELSRNFITDTGARALANFPDIGHLEDLILDGNDLTAAGIDALVGTRVRFSADNQSQEAIFDDDYE